MPEAQSDARAGLASTGWLTRCAPDFVTALLAAGRLQQLPTGVSMNHAGDAEGGIWAVVSGHLISSSGVAGPETSLTMLFGPGEWGGTGPISGFPRQLNLQARAPTTLLTVGEAAMRRLLEAQPVWWAEINRLHFQMTVKIGLMAADLQTVDSRRRVAGVLLNAAGLRLAGNGPVTLPLSQEEVGRMANLSRYPAGQMLREFARSGLLSLHYGRIGVERPAAMRAIAEGTG